MLKVAVLLAVAALLAFVSADHSLPLIGRWLAMPPTMQHADAIVVHDGNPMRTLYSVELYRRGLAPELWHTGYANGEKDMALQDLPWTPLHLGAVVRHGLNRR